MLHNILLSNEWVLRIKIFPGRMFGIKHCLLLVGANFGTDWSNTVDLTKEQTHFEFNIPFKDYKSIVILCMDTSIKCFLQ